MSHLSIYINIYFFNYLLFYILIRLYKELIHSNKFYKWMLILTLSKIPQWIKSSREDKTLTLTILQN